MGLTWNSWFYTIKNFAFVLDWISIIIDVIYSCFTAHNHFKLKIITNKCRKFTVVFINVSFHGDTFSMLTIWNMNTNAVLKWRGNAQHRWCWRSEKKRKSKNSEFNYGILFLVFILFISSLDSLHHRSYQPMEITFYVCVYFFSRLSYGSSSGVYLGNHSPMESH